MTPLAVFALIGWIPFVVCVFAITKPRRAATIAIIGAWLYLPPFTLKLSSLPDYSKVTAAGIGMLMGTLLFAPDQILKFRPRWFDLPMLLFCNSGILTSLHNGLGLYDGLSVALTDTLIWGLPYLFGRIHFGTPEALNDFAVGMIIGGLSYVLPCLLEVRISPQLCRMFYGDVKFANSMRLGGYRPQVFFYDGLECGMWMTAVSLTAWWMWRTGAIKKIGAIPFGPVVLPVILTTTVLCRSTGALGLLAVGMTILWLSARLKTRILLAGLLLVAPVYVGVRVTHTWSGQDAVDLAESLVGSERAYSLRYRFMCEDLIMERALQEPFYGWGGWERSAVYFDEERLHHVPTDGQWIILLGMKGFLGLGLFYISFVLPPLLFLLGFPARSLRDPRLAAGWLAATFLGIYLMDNMLNSFLNIIYMTLGGGLISLHPKQLTAMGVARAEGPSATSARLAHADQRRSLGRALKRQGRPEQADAAWREALDILGALLAADPGSGELRRRWCDCANDLAWLRANHPDPARRDPTSAVAIAYRAVQFCAEGATYWNTLGVAYYRAGDHQSAVAALDRARTLGGGTAFDDIFLAMAHARLGDPVEAREALELAVLRAEGEFPAHPELSGFCEEARAMLADASGSPTASL